MDGKKHCRLSVAVDRVRGSGYCVFFCEGMVIGMVEKFKRILEKACRDAFNDKLEEDLRQAHEEAAENSKITEEIMVLLKGKRAAQANTILSNVCAEIAKKQLDMRM